MAYKPRRPIGAMYKSPGPCYAMPGLIGGQNPHDPRSNHRKGPAYSFGGCHGKCKEDSSPGPIYNTGDKLYRDGKDGTPHYSLCGRPRDMTLAKTPGPGAYNPKLRTHKSCPEYSFGTRHKDKQNDGTPAPNSYNIPAALGSTGQNDKAQSVGYSMVGRHDKESVSKTPGPGTYTATDPGTYKHKSPAYSMTGRNTMPGDSSQKPGPGAHSPEVTASKPSNPEFTFGIKHSEYAGHFNPVAKD